MELLVSDVRNCAWATKLLAFVIFKGSTIQPVSVSGRSLGRSPGLCSSSTRAPKSPWMPFPMLFAAISKKVPSKDMELVTNNYELFRVCKMAWSFIIFHSNSNASHDIFDLPIVYFIRQRRWTGRILSRSWDWLLEMLYWSQQLQVFNARYIMICVNALYWDIQWCLLVLWFWVHLNLLGWKFVNSLSRGIYLKRAPGNYLPLKYRAYIDAVYSSIGSFAFDLD